LRARLAELARSLGLSDRVSLPGRKSQEELAQYFADADLFVLPCVPASDNDRDGIPNTLIEAMAMELPIISTRFSGIPELVTTDSGVLVEPDDVEGLADALAYLLGNASERRRMGEAGRRRVLASFTVGGSAERLQQTFARFLLGDGRQT
jgi:glycosyltransferase involved in cell wall biosynthesis